MYICKGCGSVIEELRMGQGGDVGEYAIEECSCGGEYEEAIECPCCGEIIAESEMHEEICDDCLKEFASIENVVKFATDNRLMEYLKDAIFEFVTDDRTTFIKWLKKEKLY